jgi:hypothetical protein
MSQGALAGILIQMVIGIIMDVSCGSSHLVHSGIEHSDKAGCDELVMHYSGTVAGRSDPVANQLLR